jgi:NADPH:quinone reductase-like Zn-dependent oxidoreductase
VQLLKDLGAEHILNSSDADFLTQLGNLAKKLRATVCFECIGGKITGQIMSIMPSNSVCIVYGLLSEQPIGDLNPLLLIGRNQRIEGFFLGDYLSDLSLWGKLSTVRACVKMISSGAFHSDVAKRINLFEMKAAIPEYKANMTAGKYIVYPHQ